MNEDTKSILWSFCIFYHTTQSITAAQSTQLTSQSASKEVNMQPIYCKRFLNRHRCLVAHWQHTPVKNCKRFPATSTHTLFSAQRCRHKVAQNTVSQRLWYSELQTMEMFNRKLYVEFLCASHCALFNFSRKDGTILCKRSPKTCWAFSIFSCFKRLYFVCFNPLIVPICFLYFSLNLSALSISCQPTPSIPANSSRRTRN